MPVDMKRFLGTTVQGIDRIDPGRIRVNLDSGEALIFEAHDGGSPTNHYGDTAVFVTAELRTEERVVV